MNTSFNKKHNRSFKNTTPKKNVFDSLNTSADLNSTIRDEEDLSISRIGPWKNK